MFSHEIHALKAHTIFGHTFTLDSTIQGGWNYPERNYPESIGIIRKTLELSGKFFACGQYWNYPEKNLCLEKSLKIQQKPLSGQTFEVKNQICYEIVLFSQVSRRKQSYSQFTI